jgi:hypothetical protein
LAATSRGSTVGSDSTARSATALNNRVGVASSNGSTATVGLAANRKVEEREEIPLLIKNASGSRRMASLAKQERVEDEDDMKTRYY